MRYLLILLLVTETKSSLNSQTGMNAVSGGKVTAPSANSSLDRGCSTHRGMETGMYCYAVGTSTWRRQILPGTGNFWILALPSAMSS